MLNTLIRKKFIKNNTIRNSRNLYFKFHANKTQTVNSNKVNSIKYNVIPSTNIE